MAVQAGDRQPATVILLVRGEEYRKGRRGGGAERGRSGKEPHSSLSGNTDGKLAAVITDVARGQ